MYRLYLFFLLFAIFFNHLWAKEACGRHVIIENQKVLIDTNTITKGEGLRDYLTKDPIAEKLFIEYQNKTRPKWKHAIIGSVGTGLFITGLTKSGSFTDSGLTSKRSLMISGLSILIINFLMVKTFQFTDETLLLRSIEEYNKRNRPRIFLGPYEHFPSKQVGVGGGIIKEF